MDVDEILASTPLPEVAVDVEAALGPTLLRGRARRRRRLIVGGAVGLTIMALVALAASPWLGGDATEVVAAGPSRGAVPSTQSPSEPLPLVVDDPRCTAATAYQAEPQPISARDNPGGGWYLESDGTLAGGIARLTDLRPGATLEDLAGLGVTKQVRMYDDDTGVVEWRDREGPLAFLSAKRVRGDELDRLGDAVAGGDIARAGYTFVAAPARTALVYGYNCRINGAFVGVEVLVGDRASQVANMASLDPTSTESHDGYTIATFNRSDGNATVPLRPVDLSTWKQLVAASAAAGGP